jgi:hypothetical protein
MDYYDKGLFGSFGVFDKLHVLYNTTLSIVLELLLDSLLLDESFPV